MNTMTPRRTGSAIHPLPAAPPKLMVPAAPGACDNAGFGTFVMRIPAPNTEEVTLHLAKLSCCA
jgi:hypothetical protein